MDIFTHHFSISCLKPYYAMGFRISLTISLLTFNFHTSFIFFIVEYPSLSEIYFCILSLASSRHNNFFLHKFGLGIQVKFVVTYFFFHAVFLKGSISFWQESVCWLDGHFWGCRDCVTGNFYMAIFQLSFIFRLHTLLS